MKSPIVSAGSAVMFIFLLFFSCHQQPIPKPRGYFRIEFPQKEYQTVTPENCPYQFEIPVYARLLKDTFPMAEPCWMDVYFERFRARLHLSYKPVKNNLGKFLNDAHSMAFKHAVRADEINESVVSNDSSVYGLIYEIGGNAASSFQFYVTDSTRHFLRGSLYFMAEPNADSIAPVAEFLKKDAIRLIETLRWK